MWRRKKEKQHQNHEKNWRLNSTHQWCSHFESISGVSHNNTIYYIFIININRSNHTWRLRIWIPDCGIRISNRNEIGMRKQYQMVELYGAGVTTVDNQSKWAMSNTRVYHIVKLYTVMSLAAYYVHNLIKWRIKHFYQILYSSVVHRTMIPAKQQNLTYWC